MMIGLSLGSGGAIGLGGVGAVNYLQSKGIEFSEISGSSMGALIGAYLSVHGEVESLKDIAISQTKKEVLRLVDFNNPKKSLIKGRKVEAFLRRHLKAKDFRQAKVPLRIVATDLFKHESVVFRKGDLIRALMASISIPGIFPPVKYRNTFLADGGISNPLPLDQLNAKKKIGVDFEPVEIRMKHLNMAETLHLAFSSMMSHANKHILSNLDEGTHVVRVRKVFRLNTMLAFHNAERYIKAGEKAARKDYRKIKRLIEE